MEVVTSGHESKPVQYRVSYMACFRLMQSGIATFVDAPQETHSEKPNCDIGRIAKLGGEPMIDAPP